MGQYKVFLTIALLLAVRSLLAQNITNVQVKTSGDQVLVSYKLKSSRFNQKFNVSLYVSLDGGYTFKGPMKSVVGDVGDDVREGSNTITWDPYQDVNSLDGSLFFDVRAVVVEEKIRRHFFMHYTGNYSLRNQMFSSPFGLSVGFVGKVGGYLSGRINANAFNRTQYSYDGHSVIDYDRVLYYEFGDHHICPSLEVNGGFTFQLGRNSFLYLGAGYGMQKYLCQIDEYSYVTNSIESSSYVDYVAYSRTGITAEVGLIFRAKAFSFSLGCSALRFESASVVLGLGFNI